MVNEETFDLEDNLTILFSCKDLIMYMRRCSERCRFLTTGEPLREFCFIVVESTKEYITII